MPHITRWRCGFYMWVKTHTVSSLGHTVKCVGGRFPKLQFPNNAAYANEITSAPLSVYKRSSLPEQHYNNLLDHLRDSLLKLWRLDGIYINIFFWIWVWSEELWFCWYFSSCLFVFNIFFSTGMITETMLKVVFVLGCLLSLALALPVSVTFSYSVFLYVETNVKLCFSCKFSCQLWPTMLYLVLYFLMLC